MAMYRNFCLICTDIKIAFFYWKLKKDVYMLQPGGNVVRCQEHKVRKLKKAMYDLKQATRVWNLKISETLTKLGFNHCLRISITRPSAGKIELHQIHKIHELVNKFNWQNHKPTVTLMDDDYTPQ